MKQLQELILAIQIISASMGLVRAAALGLEHMHDDDMTIRNKKIKHVVMAVILIETITVMGTIILHYYQ